MNPDLARALEVQELDLRIVALKTEIATLPKQIAAIEKLLDEHVRRLELDKSALGESLKDRKKHEADIQSHEQKISKLKDQMMLAKTNEQLWAFQKEIGFHESEISKIEDLILALMLDSEKLEAKVKQSQAALEEEKKSVEAQKADATKRTNADKQELSTILAHRKELSAAISPQLLATYEKLHSKMANHVAISRAENEVCLTCHMTVRPQLFTELRIGDKVIFCESCRRILYIADQPVDVEGQMNV